MKKAAVPSILVVVVLFAFGVIAEAQDPEGGASVFRVDGKATMAAGPKPAEFFY